MSNQSKQGSGQRRGFFRRAGIVAAAATLWTAVGGVGLQAHAHGGPGARGGFLSGPMHGEPTDEQLQRMLKRVYAATDATAEQQQRIAPIVKQAIADLAPLRQQMHGTRAQAMSLMSAEPVDRAAIEQLRASRLQAADALSKRMTQAMADVAEVLTPAQRKAMAERMQQRHGAGHGGGHGTGRGAGHGAGQGTGHGAGHGTGHGAGHGKHQG